MDAHSRLVATTWGRVVAAATMVVGSIWIVGPNLPAGPARSSIEWIWSPALEIGVMQDWGVFSPNPRDQSLDVLATIHHRDGTIEIWDVPDFDPLGGAYRQYRWNKWQERVRLDINTALWEPTARWLAEQHRVNGDLPARVTLVRRWRDHEPLAPGGAVDGHWNRFDFYMLELDS